jgi:hypothetical protein
MIPRVRFSQPRTPAVLLLLAALLAAPRAEAEPVTHQFVGTITTITNGSAGMLDLTGTFTMGAAVTLDCTVERSTPGVAQDAYVTAYTDPVTMVAFTIGSWSGGGAPSNSGVTVTNNAPSPGFSAQAVNYDQYSWNALGVAAPPLGTTTLQSLTSTLDDIEGTVFDSGAIPRVFPDLSVFDGKTATFLLFDFAQFKSGYVMATLSSVSTPAQATTWGGLKALYRR